MLKIKSKKKLSLVETVAKINSRNIWKLYYVKESNGHFIIQNKDYNLVNLFIFSKNYFTIYIWIFIKLKKSLWTETENFIKFQKKIE